MGDDVDDGDGDHGGDALDDDSSCDYDFIIMNMVTNEEDVDCDDCGDLCNFCRPCDSCFHEWCHHWQELSEKGKEAKRSFEKGEAGWTGEVWRTSAPMLLRVQFLTCPPTSYTYIDR